MAPHLSTAGAERTKLQHGPHVLQQTPAQQLARGLSANRVTFVCKDGVELQGEAGNEVIQLCGTGQNGSSNHHVQQQAVLPYQRVS